MSARVQKYIIRKTMHNLHPRQTVRDINAYCGRLCEAAGVRPLELYTALDAAIAAAKCLHAVEPCGWDVYLVGSCPPDIIATTSVKKEKSTS